MGWPSTCRMRPRTRGARPCPARRRSRFVRPEASRPGEPAGGCGACGRKCRYRTAPRRARCRCASVHDTSSRSRPGLPAWLGRGRCPPRGRPGLCTTAKKNIKNLSVPFTPWYKKIRLWLKSYLISKRKYVMPRNRLAGLTCSNCDYLKIGSECRGVGPTIIYDVTHHGKLITIWPEIKNPSIETCALHSNNTDKV